MNVTNWRYLAVLLPLLFVLIGQSASNETDLDVALRVTTNRSSFLQEEDIWARVCFTTKAVRPVTLTKSVMWNGKDYLYFEIKDDSGFVLKYGGPMVSAPLHKITFSKSEPYRQYITLDKWMYDLRTPGTYTLRAIYYNPIAKFRIASPEQTIEIKKIDSVQIISSKTIGKDITYELVRVKHGKDEHYLLKHYIGAGKKRQCAWCVRIKMDKDSAKRASIIQVVDGQKYRGVTIALGSKAIMLVNIHRNGPQVLTRTVDQKPDDVVLKVGRDKKYMLVGKDGKEFLVCEPATKPATQPTSRPARSEDHKTTTPPCKSTRIEAAAPWNAEST